jgi:hypothetical protein
MAFTTSRRLRANSLALPATISSAEDLFSGPDAWLDLRVALELPE